MRFRFGQVLARTEVTLSDFRLVRNLSEPHVRPGRVPEMHVRPSRLSVNGNLFGSISTRRRYSTARDPYFA